MCKRRNTVLICDDFISDCCIVLLRLVCLSANIDSVLLLGQKTNYPVQVLCQKIGTLSQCFTQQNLFVIPDIILDLHESNICFHNFF